MMSLKKELMEGNSTCELFARKQVYLITFLYLDNVRMMWLHATDFIHGKLSQHLLRDL